MPLVMRHGCPEDGAQRRGYNTLAIYEGASDHSA